jgi:hypothetical protein
MQKNEFDKPDSPKRKTVAYVELNRGSFDNQLQNENEMHVDVTAAKATGQSKRDTIGSFQNLT